MEHPPAITSTPPPPPPQTQPVPQPPLAAADLRAPATANSSTNIGTVQERQPSAVFLTSSASSSSSPKLLPIAQIATANDGETVAQQDFQHAGPESSALAPRGGGNPPNLSPAASVTMVDLDIQAHSAPPTPILKDKQPLVGGIDENNAARFEQSVAIESAFVVAGAAQKRGGGGLSSLLGRGVPVFSHPPSDRRGSKLRRAAYDYLCCCLPRTRLALFICLSATVAFLAAVAAVLYVYWPRFPSVTVLSINIANPATAFAFELAPNSTNLNTMTVQLKLAMAIAVYNDNQYDLDVSQIDLRAYLLVNTTDVARHASPAALNIQSIVGPAPVGADPSYRPSTSPLIGTGRAPRAGADPPRFRFPRKTNVTFDMDFLLTYRPDTEVGLIKDPAFAEVMNVCGITSNRRNAQIGYVAVSTVAGLSSIGFYTSVQNSVYIRCPVSQDAIEQIQNDPLAKTDPVTVLKRVIGNGTVVITDN